MPNTTQFPDATLQVAPLQLGGIEIDTDIDADLDEDNGSFDASSFAACSLSDWRKLAARSGRLKGFVTPRLIKPAKD